MSSTTLSDRSEILLRLIRTWEAHGDLLADLYHKAQEELRAIVDRAQFEGWEAPL